MASSSMSPNVVEDNIYSLLWELDPARIHEYISSLNGELKAHPVVAIASAMAYLSGDEVGRAAAAVEATNFRELVANQGWIVDEDIACLALMSAEIEARRAFKFNELVSLLVDVESVYMRLLNLDGQRKVSEEKFQLFKNRIRGEAEFLNEPEFEENCINRIVISDARLRLELRIMQTRCESTYLGLTSWDDFAKSYKQRHRAIIRYLRYHRKFILEGFFVFAPDMSEVLGSVPAAINFYSQYVQDVNVESYSQKASAYICLSARQVADNPGLAALSLDRALAIYIEKNIEIGQLICSFHRIDLFQTKSQSPADCLKQLLSLANSFLQKRNYSWYRISSFRALRVIVNDKSLLGRFAPLKELLCNQLSEMQNNTSVRRLDLWEAYDWSRHNVSAEQARLRFEDYLATKYDQLTPFWLADIYKGLYHSYWALKDHEKATEYAEKHFNFKIMCKQFSYDLRSEARHTLAVSRLALLKSHLSKGRAQSRAALDPSLLDEERAIWLKIATLEVTDLEKWIQTDIEHGFVRLTREKRIAISNISDFLETHFSEDIKNGTIVLSPHGRTDTITSDHIATDVGDLLRLAKDGKGQEGIRLANEELKRALNDLTANVYKRSQAYYVCALAYDIASWDKTMLNKVLSTQEKEENLELQIRYIREQRDLCIAVGDHHSLLRSAMPFQKFMRSCMLVHPELKSDLISETERYFLEAEKATEMYRKSVLRSHDIATLLRMQKVVSGPLNTLLYSVAVSFYIAEKDPILAWIWAQKSRARSLFDMVTRHHTSSNTLLSVLDKNAHTRDLLAGESMLAQKIDQGTAAEYVQAKSDLQSQRQKLMAVPVLENLLGTPVTKDSFGFSEAGAIYSHVKSWLPSGKNVILVNWFIEASGWICLMTMDGRRKEVRTRSRLAIPFPEVRKWIDKYLNFPRDSMPELEKKKRALSQLKVLVEALSFMTEPEDLLVFSPPAEFAAIPLHGIPIGDDGPIMIERNPIVYASSFSLYLECVCRVQVCDGLGDRSLTSATFTAAYEGLLLEEREERAVIFDKMKELSNCFGARHVLGHNLTAGSFKSALENSPWVHYHGHADYKSSEALNQCYVLSNGEELPIPDDSQDNPIHRNITQLDLSLSQAPKDVDHNNPAVALLAASSTISVSDIFAMDLRATKPFICSIACDSGVQDVSEGDEPLGLVSAFFCAGASSVLGTLWPTQSQTGRLFTEKFYSSLAKQIKEAPADEPRFGRVLNVARAFREAVIALKKEKKDPYSWASFVLHGAGFYRIEQRQKSFALRQPV